MKTGSKILLVGVLACVAIVIVFGYLIATGPRM